MTRASSRGGQISVLAAIAASLVMACSSSGESTSMDSDEAFTATDAGGGPSDAAADADGDADARPDADAAPKQCCVCQYWDVKNPSCGASTTATACGTNPDCRWTAAGVCQNRHERDCDTWMKQQVAAGKCDAVAILPSNGPPNPGGNPTGGLQGCTSFSYDYEGHSNTHRCENYTATAGVCITAFPGCSNFSFTNNGCATFSNLGAALQQAQAIQALLGGSQCATISANQCYSSESCNTQYEYTVTPTGTCGKPLSPCIDGGLCHKQDQTAVCTTPAGPATERCCCDGAGKNCTFRKDALVCPVAAVEADASAK